MWKGGRLEFLCQVFCQHFYHWTVDLRAVHVLPCQPKIPKLLVLKGFKFLLQTRRGLQCFWQPQEELFTAPLVLQIRKTNFHSKQPLWVATMLEHTHVPRRPCLKWRKCDLSNNRCPSTRHLCSSLHRNKFYFWQNFPFYWRSEFFQSRMACLPMAPLSRHLLAGRPLLLASPSSCSSPLSSFSSFTSPSTTTSFSTPTSTSPFSSSAPSFPAIAKTLPKTYQAKGERAAKELSALFSVSADGLVVNGKTETSIRWQIHRWENGFLKICSISGQMSCLASSWQRGKAPPWTKLSCKGIFRSSLI